MAEVTVSKIAPITIDIFADELGELLESEWLLTNQRGSYSSSTVIGCNTRRYHGLLVASLRPPVERVVTLSNVLDRIEIGEKVYELANLEFSDRIHPRGYQYQKRCLCDEGVHFEYDLDGMRLTKSIYLAYDRDQLMMVYDFSQVPCDVKLKLMPMVSLRDFHSLQSSSASLYVEEGPDAVTVHGVDHHGPAVHMHCSGARFGRSTDWWYAVRYRQETRRGQSDYEDVWVPGSFEQTIVSDGQVVLSIQATAGWERPGPMGVDDLIGALEERQSLLLERAGVRDESDVILVRSADQFIVRRRISESRESSSILAGYHWFADWGRDTFIALPGLLLSTGRCDEAREVLQTFGAAVDGGQIPNRFDDYSDQAHYNSVDASLWYINAAYHYSVVSGDRETFDRELRHVAEAIINGYTRGTRDDIHADADGLITAGNAETQLTWMDAKCGGVAFTPRFGKAVEINALWYNALRIMAETTSDEPERRQYNERAERVSESFRALFWNDAAGCLYDCVYPDGSKDGAIRPNQIFAVSLPFTCLTPEQQHDVVEVVEVDLLTPYGLRSLSPRDSRYRSHYGGDQFQRDSAYHQGTVWGYLIGPFVEAFLKVNDFSDTALVRANSLIQTLLKHLTGKGCLGSVSEIFDGDWPHRPCGCVAQAWSVGELLRVKKMILDSEK